MYELNGAPPTKTNIAGKYEATYPIAKMKVGDWFFVPAGDRKRSTVNASCRGTAARYGFKLSIRAVPDGTKVIRTE